MSVVLPYLNPAYIHDRHKTKLKLFSFVIQHSLGEFNILFEHIMKRVTFSFYPHD